jgi:hypothetical protein
MWFFVDLHWCPSVISPTGGDGESHQARAEPPSPPTRESGGAEAGRPWDSVIRWQPTPLVVNIAVCALLARSACLCVLVAAIPHRRGLVALVVALVAIDDTRSGAVRLVKRFPAYLSHVAGGLWLDDAAQGAGRRLELDGLSRVCGA